MRAKYLKNLDKQEAYNITDSLSILLHEISLKRLGLDWNTMPTDDSNEILEICDDAIEHLHEELFERLIEWKETNQKGVELK